MQATKTFAALCIMLPLAAFAQTALAQTNTPQVDQREMQQQARIQQGARSGALTQKEYQRLESGQQHVANMESKAKADGVVTKQERQKLRHAEDVQSRHIFNQKHDRQHDYNHDGQRDRPHHRS